MADSFRRRRFIGRSRGARHKWSVRPVVERIEDRLLLSADTFWVNSTSGGSVADPNNPDKGSLPYVVALANADPNGSVIEFDPVLFSSSSPQTILLDDTLTLSEASGQETIDGPGAGVVSISGGHAFGVFDVASGVTARISGLTITGGSASYRGGGVNNSGNLTLSDCTISGNSAPGAGGGIQNYKGTATLSGCTISGNSTGFGGGFFNDFGTATLSGCTISGNFAKYNGGGFNNDHNATATLTDCTLSGNAVGAGGGGGGGLMNNWSTSTVTLSGCTISGNSAVDVNDTGSFGGGGMNNHGMATLSGCTISGNSDYIGGGLENFGTATINGGTIGGNTSQSSGGGLFNYGTATLSGCTISGNTVLGGNSSQTGGGGGLDNFGPARLYYCTISDNSAFDGGGLDNFNTAKLTDCTISGNSTRNGGGGLFNDTGTATLTDCTISGNSAQVRGGGLTNDYSTVTLTACTISGNTVGKNIGGGLDNARSQSTATLTDTIVGGNIASNGAASDINNGGGNLTGTHNLIGTGGSGGIAGGTNGNIVLTSLVNLGLGALANNGGSYPLQTQTMALQPGSVAIGRGITAGISKDQRGDPLDSPPDIGAFQANEPSSTTEPATSVTSTTATLNASVDPHGCETSAWFIYSSTDPTLATGSTRTPGQDIGEGTGSVAVGADLTGLAPDTTYYYAVVAANAGGTTDGKILSFSTAARPAPVIDTPIAAPSPPPVAGQTSTIDVSASAPAGDSLTWDLTGASWATIASAGPTTAVITLSPGKTTSGTFPLTLTATDTTTGEVSSPATQFSVTVGRVNAPAINAPIAAPSPPPVAGQTSTIDVSATAPAGDSVSWALSNQPSWVTIASTGATTAVITLQPGTGEFGSFAFAVTATDTNTQEPSNPQTIHLTVKAGPPGIYMVAPSPPPVAGQTSTIDVSASVPAGDSVTWALSGPPWASITPTGPTTAVIALQPHTKDFGSFSLIVSATDTATQETGSTPPFNLTVAKPPPPAVNQVPGQSITGGTNPQVFATPGYVPSGDSLTWSLTGGPSWAQINPGTGVITLAPPVNASGPFSVYVTATDTVTQETSNPMQFLVSVTKPAIPPTFTAAAPSLNLTSGQSQTVGVPAGDAIGDPIRFSLASAPAWVAIDLNTGAVTVSPPISVGGSASVTVQATDVLNPSLYAFETFAVSVQGVVPQVVGESVTTRVKKGATGLTIFFNEPLDPGDAGNAGHYTVRFSKTTRGKINKVLGGVAAQYNATNNSVTLRLPKPQKFHIQVTFDGVRAATGATGGGGTFQVQ